MWYHVRRGFGKIFLEDGKEAFVHASNLVGQEGYALLFSGEKVSCDIKEDNQGLACFNVQLISERRTNFRENASFRENTIQKGE